MRNFENIGRIKVFIKDPNKKSVFRIIKEVFILLIKKKEIPYYYFKYLYRKGVPNYLDYLSTKEIVAIGKSKELHKPEYTDLLDNKFSFAQFCEKTSIKSPRIIGYNLKSSFYFNKKKEQISSIEMLSSFFRKVFASTNIESLFFRPHCDYGGKGCFKLKRDFLTYDLDSIYDLMINDNYVYTETVKQHEEINKIHSKSLNTIRIISLITSENNIEIISAFIRFGVGDSVVDNVSSGGFFVGINIENGTLKETGHYLPEYGGGEIYKHPDSGFQFKGFKIPYFKEVCEEVIKAVKIIPDRFIGWDVAITSQGPIIIEPNDGPHLPMSNIAYGGLLKNKHIKKLVEELKSAS